MCFFLFVCFLFLVSRTFFQFLSPTLVSLPRNAWSFLCLVCLILVPSEILSSTHSYFILPKSLSISFIPNYMYMNHIFAPPSYYPPSFFFISGLCYLLYQNFLLVFLSSIRDIKMGFDQEFFFSFLVIKSWRESIHFTVEIFDNILFHTLKSHLNLIRCFLADGSFKTVRLPWY